MSTINRTFKKNGVLADPTTVTLSDSTGAYGVKRNDTDAVVVADATAMTKISTGVYQYVFTDPADDLTYTYSIEIVADGATNYFSDTLVGPTTGSSDNAFTFSGLCDRVGMQQYGAVQTGANLVLIKQMVNDGLMMFYAEHDWNFLRPSATLAITEDDTETDLPAGFANMEDPFRFAAGSGYYGSITETTPNHILMLRQGGSVTGYPRLYAIRPKALTATTGQRWEVMWYPTISADLTLSYRYRVTPSALVNDADFPYGHQLHSMAILEACLCQMEVRKGDVSGVHHRLYRGPDPNRVGGLLLTSIKRDLETRPSNLGPITNGRRVLPFNPNALLSTPQ